MRKCNVTVLQLLGIACAQRYKRDENRKQRQKNIVLQESFGKANFACDANICAVNWYRLTRQGEKTHTRKLMNTVQRVLFHTKWLRFDFHGILIFHFMIFNSRQLFGYCATTRLLLAHQNTAFLICEKKNQQAYLYLLSQSGEHTKNCSGFQKINR